MSLKPGKWYGVRYTERRIVPCAVLKAKHPDDLESATIPRVRPFGIYIEPQWVCQTKGYAVRSFLPDRNEKPADPGPVRYFEFHAFLRPDGRMSWVNHEHIDRLEELNEETYKERLGCGNPDCTGFSIKDDVIAYGTDLRLGEIVDPCHICSALHRKVLKARGVTYKMILPDPGLSAEDILGGL